jgi:hypothetical protein
MGRAMSTCNGCRFWRGDNTISGVVTGLCSARTSHLCGFMVAGRSASCDAFQKWTPPTLIEQKAAELRDPYGGRD